MGTVQPNLEGAEVCHVRNASALAQGPRDSDAPLQKSARTRIRTRSRTRLTEIRFPPVAHKNLHSTATRIGPFRSCIHPPLHLLLSRALIYQGLFATPPPQRARLDASASSRSQSISRASSPRGSIPSMPSPLLQKLHSL